jgi:hypothetical protein
LALQNESGFDSCERSHGQHGLTDSKGLIAGPRLALVASFGFVLTHFSGCFADSIGLSGFVLQNGSMPFTHKVLI